MYTLKFYNKRLKDFTLTTLIIPISTISLLCCNLNSQAQGILPPGVVVPKVSAWPDIITYVDQITQFEGFATAPDGGIVKYEWDFDGDGSYDFDSPSTGKTSFTFTSPGTYKAILRVHDSQGNKTLDMIKVIVKTGKGKQEYLPRVRIKPRILPLRKIEANGIVNRYAIMINGGWETRFWNDVTFMYSTLTKDYNFTAEHIYLFNWDGNNPDGVNPNNMIDYPATLSNIDAVFTVLSNIIDNDDELFVWVTNHGRGYNGPKSVYYGYLDGSASVDPGDEQDYLESEFKLRSIFTGGDYRCNHGMNVLKVCYKYLSNYGAYVMYRNKFVSRFTDVYFERSGIQSDDDIYIERLVDYLLGDTDRDGIIETDQGEVFDYDRDGNPPYDHATGIFDEDDWGDWNYYDDNIRVNTAVPGGISKIFDYNFDNHVDIDINYHGGSLEVDGTDIDNQGLFDGLDVNDDGDMDDWVSIDEKIKLCGLFIGNDMLDDEMAIFMNRINAKTISIFMQQCFSGGFIDDLSASNRVISTATEEETASWGNLFAELFTNAFHWATRNGEPVDADYDGNGYVSMMEAFNYAAENDIYDEIPQYDDNGDGIGHPYPIPNAGDGSLGATTYLLNFVYLSYEFEQIGWYMVSLPVIPADSIVNTLFPSSLGAFGWNTTAGTYYDVEKMDPTVGYWLAIPDGTTDEVYGLPLNQYTAHYSDQGWYMIGSVVGGTDFSDPDDNPDGMVLVPAFGFDPASSVMSSLT